MDPTAKVDLSGLDREAFTVADHGGRFLVVPKKSKYRWAPDELHLRSLLLDAQGRVLSSGFPKFFNLGEDPAHDAALLEAREVAYTEKRDGSLVIVDRIDGRAHLRTRGSHDLGLFTEPVWGTLRERYPALAALLDGGGGEALAWHSLLFEFTAPENRIVVRYDQAELSLLGRVDKRTLEADLDDGEGSALRALSEATGVPLVPTVTLPADPREAQREVWRWRESEGVVARFRHGGRWMQLKLKGEWYLALHALRFRLGPAELRKLCFLRGAFTEGALRDLLAGAGHDHEAMEFLRTPFEAYLDARAALLERWERFGEAVRALPGWSGERRALVQQVRETIAAEGHPAAFFAAAMHLADGRTHDAALVVESLALGEPMGALRSWLRDPGAEVAAILAPGPGGDEGE